ncbi:MAG: TldD/PmbA family protein [Acidimicrobiales bacterium]
MTRTPGETTRRLVSIAEQVIDGANAAEQVEVALGQSASTSVRAYDGEIEALTVADTAGIGVRVITGGRQGFASAGSLEPDVVDELLPAARENARYAIPDDHVRLATPDDVEPPSLDLWDESLGRVEIDEKVALALGLERAVVESDPRIVGVRSASYGDRMTTSAVVSTTGITAAESSTAASAGVLALARDGSETQTGSGFATARGLHGLDWAEAAADASERALRLLGASQPHSRRVTLVLEPRLAASILGVVAGMLSGDRALKGRTPFADRVGESIAATSLDMIDDPTDPTSLGATTFDGEGLACRATTLITSGRLAGFLYDTPSASKAGLASTASAVRGLRSTPTVGWHAVAVAPGDRPWSKMISEVADGVLVQSMTGLHSGVNPVSGDFSVGVDGMAVRGGEVAEPIREATIASTLPKLLADVVALGDVVEHRPGGVSCPAIAISDVSLSGT